MTAENLEKYADPELYDHLYDRYQKDLDLIVKWAGESERILELACGTGRLTIPMARMGYRMTGIDLHEGMLERASRKAEEAGLSIEFFHQDCVQLNLPSRFPVAFMTGNSFQHFLTNEAQNALLEAVQRHLEKDGIFIFDTRNPVLRELAAVEEYEERFNDHAGNDIVEAHCDTYDHLTQILDCRTTRQVLKNGVFLRAEEDSIRLRYSFPQEMARLFEENGFEIARQYGDWDGSALHAESVSMVYVVRRI